MFYICWCNLLSHTVNHSREINKMAESCCLFLVPISEKKGKTGKRSYTEQFCCIGFLRKGNQTFFSIPNTKTKRSGHMRLSIS